MFRTACALGLAGLALAAPSAMAANVTRDFFGPGTVGYGDTLGAPNDITVSSPYQSGTFRFHDDYSFSPPLTVNSPCTVVDAVTADCPADGIDQVFVFPSAGDDTVSIDSSVTADAVSLGGYGNDVLSGASGDDILSGNWGDDQVYGGYGDDTLSDSAKFFILFFFPPGIDTWGDGNDHLDGGPDNDTLDAGSLVDGTGAGSDVLDGGSGVDKVDYSQRTAPLNISEDATANDGGVGEKDNVVNVERFVAGSGPDKIASDDKGNVLLGMGGNDILTGGKGADQLYGGSDTDPTGSGNDVLDGGTGGDRLSGGDGYDIATYASRSVPITASLDGVANDGASGEGDNVMPDIEDVRGGSVGDTLSGSSGADTLVSLGGDDTLHGLGGDDKLLGGEGADTIDGASGDDSIDGGVGNDVITGGSGDDSITCGPGDDTVHAGPGDTVAADCEHVDGLPAPAPAPTPAPSPAPAPQPDPGSPGAPGTPGATGTPGTPQPKPAPGPRVSVRPKKIRFDRHGRAKLTVVCPATTTGACRGQVTVARKGTLVKVRFFVAAGHRKSLRVHLTKRGRRALKHSHGLRAKLTARASDSRGVTGTVHRKVTLLRKR